MNRQSIPLILFLVLGAAACCLAAQEPAPAAKPCSSEEYRQFDFWLGEWSVTAKNAPQGRPPSANRISAIHGGCALLEEYSTPGGYTGSSLNYYDRTTGTWNQTWIDNQGGSLQLRGHFENGAMVLADEGTDGKINRITWTPESKKTVRQHWEVSEDGGTSWKTLFDGTYRRK